MNKLMVARATTATNRNKLNQRSDLKLVEKSLRTRRRSQQEERVSRANMSALLLGHRR